MSATSDDTRDALERLLRWYAAMGVDAAVDEMPHDRFAAPPAVAASRPPPTDAPARAAAQPPVRDAAFETVPASAEALVRQAGDRAAAAGTLDALREAFAGQPGLGLATSARMILAGGVPGARLMLIGATPDSHDERQGEIFAGAAGRLLDAMLRAIGLDRTGVYLAHVVPWRPPGNRPPTPLELAVCLPYARRHIALARPDVILCLGERAAQPLLASSDPISRLRGRWHAYEGDTTTVKLMATFSPSYLMSQPLQKRRAWVDLQAVRTALATPG